MGIFTHTMADHNSPVTSARFFRAFCVDNHSFMPKALPSFFQSVDIVHGDPGSVGSVYRLNFSEGTPFKYAINRVDEIDETKFYIKYTTIEGGVLRDTMERAVYEFRFEPAGEGTHYTMVVHFHSKGDYEMKDEEIAAGKEFINKLFDSAEEYLTANPQLYA